MADIDGIPPTTNWQFRPTKLRAYEALYGLNRGFEITLIGLEQLEQLGMFRPEFLNAYKIMVEHVRAQANQELIRTLQDYELRESARFDRLQRDWEDQIRDPNDVLLKATHRRQAIKDQIRDLQRGLQQQGSRRRKS